MVQKQYTCDISNERADKACAILSGESRQRILELFELGLIKVNGKLIKKSSKLMLGDIIEITFPKEEPTTLTPKNIAFETVYDTKDYAIINKPAGLTVHPAPGNYDNTLVHGLLYSFKIEDSDESRPGIVHRLDKDTSGLLIIAKNERYKRLLSDLFLRREIKKKYYAIMNKRENEEVAWLERRVEVGISRDKVHRQRMMADPNGRNALTVFRKKSEFKNSILCDTEIFTGRTHQIRVHASYIHHPIVGDTLYRGRALHGFNRQALHSYFLEFNEPDSNKLISISIDLPDDMKELLEKLV